MLFFHYCYIHILIIDSLGILQHVPQSHLLPSHSISTPHPSAASFPKETSLPQSITNKTKQNKQENHFHLVFPAFQHFFIVLVALGAVVSRSTPLCLMIPAHSPQLFITLSHWSDSGPLASGTPLSLDLH